MTYPPLDTLKAVAADVFIVTVLDLGVGKVLRARMTLIRLTNGALLLHSPVGFTVQLKAELQAIGRIAHLVAPNVSHTGGF